MGKSEATKALIIKAAIKLIQQHNGNVEQITIRKIAESTGVGIGLINHYFGSKAALMEICVQQVISDVIASFRPNVEENSSRKHRVTHVASQVMDFLMDNQEISKMSILSDMNNPRDDDNTTGSVRGFSVSIPATIPPQEGTETAFLLTAILQVSFLRKNVLKKTIGVDFNVKTERDAYIARVVDKLLGSDCD
jgi:AcrR family transcriptional regulator